MKKVAFYDGFSHRPRKSNYSRPRRHDEEEQVITGLSVSPSDMIEMTMRNEPITPQNLGMVYDEGYSKLDFEPPIQFKRGIDIGDAWEAQMDSKRKLRDAMDKGLLVEETPPQS